MRRWMLLLVIDPVRMTWTWKVNLLFFDVRSLVSAHGLSLQATDPESASYHPSIDGEGRTDDIGSLVRSDEHDCVCNLVRSADAFGRSVALEKVCFVFLRLRKAGEQYRK